MRSAAEVIARPSACADQTQQQTFHQKLPQQPRARRAHCRAHSNLAPASLRSGQKQPGDVDSRQQPDCQHQSVQRQQAGANIAGEEARVVSRR